MASSGTLANGVSSYSSTLVASTADLVTFSDRYRYVSVTNTGGSGVIYVRADGVTAVGAANNTIAVGPGQEVVIANGLKSWYQSSNVILAGAVAYPEGAGDTTATPNGQPGEVQPYMSSNAGQAANPGTLVSLVSSGTPTYTVAGAG